MVVKNTIPNYDSCNTRREEQKKLYRMLLLQLRSNEGKKQNASDSKDNAS